MRKRLRLTHERAAQVFGFLADFAELYPSLCEGSQATYRDLCRAAMACMEEESKCESMLLARGVDELVYRACREDIGGYIVRRLREQGLRVSLADGAIRVGPKEKITPAIAARIRNWSKAIRAALLTEGLNDPAILRLKAN